MPKTAKDLRAAYARAEARIREAEDTLLAERRRAQELNGLYAEADIAVSPDALPHFMKENS